MVGELVEEFGERFFGGVGICKSKNVQGKVIGKLYLLYFFCFFKYFLKYKSFEIIKEKCF